jgi:hypothetical protein
MFITRLHRRQWVLIWRDPTILCSAVKTPKSKPTNLLFRSRAVVCRCKTAYGHIPVAYTAPHSSVVERASTSFKVKLKCALAALQNGYVLFGTVLI